MRFFLLLELRPSLDEGGRNARLPHGIRNLDRAEGARDQKRECYGSDDLSFHRVDLLSQYVCAVALEKEFASTTAGDKEAAAQDIVPKVGIVSDRWIASRPCKSLRKSLNPEASPRLPSAWGCRHPRPPAT